MLELDKLEAQKVTISSMRRKKEIEEELNECQVNMLKFKKYLKEFKWLIYENDK